MQVESGSSAPADVSLQHELEQLRAESTRQQLEAEQALHDLTGQLSALEAQVNEEKQRANQASAEAERERVHRGELESQLNQLRSAGEQQVRLTQQRQRDQEDHEKEKRELLQVVERAQQDNHALQGE
jgi:chromosome segregation ATPase